MKRSRALNSGSSVLSLLTSFIRGRLGYIKSNLHVSVTLKHLLVGYLGTVYAGTRAIYRTEFGLLLM